MDNTNSPKFIQLPSAEVNTPDLIQYIQQLHQVIDKMANTLAMQKELIQQLKDEIASLKGQKPKPKIQPSKLEGQNRKPDWHKRIGLYDGKMKTFFFSNWFRSSKSLSVQSSLSHFSIIIITTLLLQARTSDISRLARQAIKKIRRIGKPGQPRGKPRKKKRTLLQIHNKPVIHTAAISRVNFQKMFKGIMALN